MIHILYVCIYIIIFFYFDVFLLNHCYPQVQSIFLFHLHISEARSLQRGGKRCLSLRGGFWTAMAIGLERNCLDTQQIRADPRNLGQKAEQKQPKIWFCVHHLDFFFGNFPWDLSNKDVGYIWLSGWIWSPVFHHWNDDRHGESSRIIPKCPNIFRFSKMVLGKYGKMMIKWSTTGFFWSFSDKPLCWKTYPYQPFVKKRTTPLDKVSVFRFFLFFRRSMFVRNKVQRDFATCWQMKSPSWHFTNFMLCLKINVGILTISMI